VKGLPKRTKERRDPKSEETEERREAKSNEVVFVGVRWTYDFRKIAETK
jgi:hypothetical protein